MTISNDTAQHSPTWLTEHQDAVAAVQPLWADPAFTQVDIEGHVSLRFARWFDDVEVVQYALGETVDSALVLEDEPLLGVGSLSRIDIDPPNMEELGEVGAMCIRASQYVAAATGTATDVRMLTLSDLLHLAEAEGVTVSQKFASLIESGVL